VLGPLLFLIFVQDLPDWVRTASRCFADDTQIWTKIASQDDADSLQQDLDRLVQWSAKWLLEFTPLKCKVMKIGHMLPTRYTMKDGSNVIELETTEKEKDLGVYITKDLKSQEQCVQSAKKAQSVLGMVKQHFKVVDKKTSTCCIKRIYDHILNTACRYGRHTSKKTLNVWKLFNEGQQSRSKD